MRWTKADEDEVRGLLSWLQMHFRGKGVSARSLLRFALNFIVSRKLGSAFKGFVASCLLLFAACTPCGPGYQLKCAIDGNGVPKCDCFSTGTAPSTTTTTTTSTTSTTSSSTTTSTTTTTTLPKPTACYPGPWRFHCKFPSCEIQGEPDKSLYESAAARSIERLGLAGMVMPEPDALGVATLIEADLKDHGYCAATHEDKQNRLSDDEIGVWTEANPRVENLDVCLAIGGGRCRVLERPFMVARGFLP